MKKYILILLLIPLTYGLTKAQDTAKVTYGIKLGINNSSTTRSSSLEEVTSSKMKSFTSYSITLVVDVPLSKVLSVEPALSYTTKGQKKDAAGTSNDEESKVKYLELPVNLIYKYKNFFGGAGPYAATALKGTIEKGSQKTDLSFGSSYFSATSKNNDDWERFDWGLNALLGYKFKKFTFSVNYEFGLKDINPNPYYESKNRVGSLMVGFMF